MSDRAALVEKVAKAIFYESNLSHLLWEDEISENDRNLFRVKATAAIDLIRAETLEEAAKVAEAHATNASGPVERATSEYIAAAIRALKRGT